MPAHLSFASVDWGWSQRSERERALIRRWRPRLDHPHEEEGLAALLRAASAELTGVPVRLVAEWSCGRRTLVLARDGEVDLVALTDVVGERPGRDLPALDHQATITCGAATRRLPLHYRSAPELRAAMDLAAAQMTAGAEEFIARLGFDRYLVTLRPGRAELVTLASVPASGCPEHREIVRALLTAAPGDLFTTAPAARV